MAVGQELRKDDVVDKDEALLFLTNVQEEVRKKLETARYSHQSKAL